MKLFSNEDLQAITQLQFCPKIKPSFDAIKYCLIWEDERPKYLSIEGYETLCDLWIARYFIYHRKLPR